MKATLTIENENATAFEQFLEETFEGAQTFRIRERDFHTDFIFEDQTTEEIEFLDELENDFKNGIRQIQH